MNRGFAVLGDELFMTTLDAHLVALDTKTGKVRLGRRDGATTSAGYASTVAPLVVKDKVIVGIAGGEFAIRGFLDAYDPDDRQARSGDSGPCPRRASPAARPGRRKRSWERGGGPTWLTGTYDPELNLIYWGTGNPNPDFYGADRKGDNLYTELARRARRRTRAS